MANKKYFIVLDTETCNSVNEPIPYDLGWVVCDRNGVIYERRSYVINEVFFDMADVMQTAYYAEKIPKYLDDIKSGKRIARGFWEIRRVMMRDIQTYNVKEIGAYNMAFDKKALNNLIRYVSKSWKRWFFPYGMEYFCIWNMACDVLLNRKSYIQYALENDFVSEANNIQTSAECAYRYITKQADFVESHTGLEDVQIEVAIMTKCYKLHKRMERRINKGCWRKVQTARKVKGL